MSALVTGQIAISPPGALGVAFFYHLTRALTAIEGDVRFMARPGSESARALERGGQLLVEDERGQHPVSLENLLLPKLTACHAAGSLPEVLLVCPNPDQILPVITDYVELLQCIHRSEGLHAETLPTPILVLCSNGIYFQRIRQIFLETLEEATLLGRLPDLWPDIMPRIVGRFLRGVTIQTGLREGSGSMAVYRPGPSGITRLVGGEQSVRTHCCEVLRRRGAWFELAGSASPTRLEFDKAMVNLGANLLGQIYAIDDHGRFKLLRIEEITGPEHIDEIRHMAQHVFRIGQAVNAYQREEPFEPVFESVRASFDCHRTHVPSSLQWVDLRRRAGQLTPELTPTETWLLEPLIRYARSAGLDESAQYFEELRDRLLVRLTKAAS